MTEDEFDLTCKCGPNHDDCGIDCQCACHDATGENDWTREYDTERDHESYTDDNGESE